MNNRVSFMILYQNFRLSLTENPARKICPYVGNYDLKVYRCWPLAALIVINCQVPNLTFGGTSWVLASLLDITRPRIVKNLHTYAFKMDKAYLRHAMDNDTFQLTFQYVNPDLKVNRQFNFCRQLAEPVRSFLERVNANVEKIVLKRNKKKKTNPDDSELPTINASLVLNNAEVNGDIRCKDVFNPDNHVILKVLNHEYSVIVNSPWIENLTLPNSILANFPVYPSKFEAVYTDKKLSEFIWFKSKDKKEWFQTGKGFVYIPSNEDINQYLKLNCIPKNEHNEGPLVEIVSEVKAQASPGECPFDLRHEYTKQRATGKEFRVVSYNILADLYCDSEFSRHELYPYCPPYALNIDYRKLLIAKELLGYNADIICLQEVDRKVFSNDLEPLFSNLDYESTFSLKGGLVAEGLACFFNSNRFKLLDNTRIILAEHINKDPLFADIWEKIEQNSKLSERILNRTTAVQTTTLQSKEYDEVLLIANTHLYFHPDADHIRLLQAGLLMKYVTQVYKELQQKHTDKRISLILCGDFNSVPECGIYQLMTTGQVSQDCIDFQSNKDESLDNVNLVQPFPLDSACGTPQFTNYTAGFSGCLDYIFYDRSKLGVSKVVPLPSLDEIVLHTALPSIVFPSDHIALVCDLKWT